MMRNFDGHIVSSSNRWFWSLIVLLFAFRFYLGNTTEIVGGEYDTDLLAYLINVGYWGHQQDPVRPPFMPALGWLVMKSGLPYRLFLELAFLGGTLWLAKLVRKEWGGALAVVMAALVLFNPYTIRSFTEAQREPLLLVLYLLMFGFLLYSMQKLRSKDMPVCGLVGLFVALACIVLTREGEELFAAVIVMVVLVFVFFYRRHVSVRKIAFALLLAAVSASMLVVVSAALNKKYFGVRGYRGLFSYETKLLSQLHKIKTDDARRYAPITSNTFRLAAEKSPKFAEFGKYIPEPNQYFDVLREHSSEFVGAKEIDPTRTIWAINRALSDQYGVNEKLKAQKLQEATDELRDLLKSGALPSVGLPLPYPFDPNLQHWVADLPGAGWSLLKQTVVLSGDFAGLGVRKDFNPPNFDSALNRRTALVERQFEGAPHKVREFFVNRYPVILAAGCLLLLLWPAAGTSAVGVFWLGAVLACLLLRTAVTAVLFTSVAPVSRYMVFSAPLFAMCLPVLIVSFKAAAAKLAGRRKLRLAAG